MFDEDRGRIKKENAPENFGLPRRLALCLLKKEATSKRSIKGKRLRALLDEGYLWRGLCGNAENQVRMPCRGGRLAAAALPPGFQPNRGEVLEVQGVSPPGRGQSEEATVRHHRRGITKGRTRGLPRLVSSRGTVCHASVTLCRCVCTACCPPWCCTTSNGLDSIFCSRSRFGITKSR